MPSFDEIADELYGLPAEQVIAARIHYEKLARQGGDRELAARIRGLAKPNAAAWLANQLVRKCRDELEPLLELGAALREATLRLEGEQLRQLSRQQRQLIHALVRQARQLAEVSGHAVSDAAERGLEDTLHAALADAGAAETLLTGRLTESLQHSGFGDLPASLVGPDKEEQTPPAKRQRQGTNGELRLAQHDLQEAERALGDAVQAQDTAQGQLAKAERVVETAHKQVEKLRGQLELASVAAADAETDRRKQAVEVRQAERSVIDRQRRLTQAQTRRDRLGHN